MSLVFYDTETTGPELFFDQILRFAAIQTDEDLNEIDRFEIRCRVLPHVVPSPTMMSLIGARVSHLIDPCAPSHYEMIRAIRAKLLSWSPALFVGWNSMRSGEVLIRQALYKTLHSPYFTNRDGNSRSDVMRIFQGCSLHAADAISIPPERYGIREFNLREIALLNGFISNVEQGAVWSVEATIFLCQLLTQKAPQVWSSFMRFSTKPSVVDYITNERIFCLSDFFFDRPYSYIVTKIGQNHRNDNDCYVYDLSIDPASLLLLSPTQLAIRLGQSPKPVRSIKCNAAPIICSAEDAPGICKGQKHSFEELERRAEMVQTDTALGQSLASAFQSQKKDYPPSIHIENQIYDGFVENSDEFLMDVFHETIWPERFSIIEQFKDPRLKAIGRQLIHLERPDLLDRTLNHEYELVSAKRLLGQGPEISWLTLPQALEQLEEMLENGSESDSEILREHEHYLRERLAHALALVN